MEHNKRLDFLVKYQEIKKIIKDFSFDERIALARSEMKRVLKLGENKYDNYKFVRIEDVIDEANKSLVWYGLRVETVYIDHEIAIERNISMVKVNQLVNVIDCWSDKSYSYSNVGESFRFKGNKPNPRSLEIAKTYAKKAGLKDAFNLACEDEVDNDYNEVDEDYNYSKQRQKEQEKFRKEITDQKKEQQKQLEKNKDVFYEKVTGLIAKGLYSKEKIKELLRWFDIEKWTDFSSEMSKQIFFKLLFLFSEKKSKNYILIDQILEEITNEEAFVFDTETNKFLYNIIRSYVISGKLSLNQLAENQVNTIIEMRNEYKVFMNKKEEKEEKVDLKETEKLPEPEPNKFQLNYLKEILKIKDENKIGPKEISKGINILFNLEKWDQLNDFQKESFYLIFFELVKQKNLDFKQIKSMIKYIAGEEIIYNEDGKNLIIIIMEAISNKTIDLKKTFKTNQEVLDQLKGIHKFKLKK